MKKQWPEDDAEVIDPLESREFYELMQAYRHHLMAVDQFEAVKAFIRNMKDWGKE